MFPSERWAATFRSHAQRILKRLSDYLGYPPSPLLDRMVADAQKIHQ
jgi:putative transposase